ncbi:MAG: dihydropteroate synthase [Rickettsiales bacterium]|jgi:2-amino-4-hydroxy-6-hydroxymethyldihydropteridine diphosphokinase/dihydropteroate synthase|nr:dihydropteroate synthase [Rickettsiales bacterium]
MDNDSYVYLALGSNLGNRENNMASAISKLSSYGVVVLETSPLYATPALMLKDSPEDWNRPFLNCAIKVDTSLQPEELLDLCKKIEVELRGDHSRRWAPRTIDVDILFYKNQTFNSDRLTIPHSGIYNRSFVMDPLSFLYPEKVVGRYYSKSHQPLIMGIVNVTPDSFSDGGLYYSIDSFAEVFDNWSRENVQIIDIGAESTNPRVEPIAEEEEIRRLEPIFDYIESKNSEYPRPLLSIDTYHSRTAELAITNGFDIVNDVSALENEKMLDLAKNNPRIKFVFMHNLGIPTRKNVIVHGNIIEELKKWLESKLENFDRVGIDRNQLIFDPGLGFGKTSQQNLEILQNVSYFHRFEVKIMIGHSRKSFMNIFSSVGPELRDCETVAMSMKLAKDVDILRVHSPVEHMRAILAQGHVDSQFI